MKLKIRPLTPDQWPALVDLFGEKGACNGCRCMEWQIGNTYRTSHLVTELVSEVTINDSTSNESRWDEALRQVATLQRKRGTGDGTTRVYSAVFPGREATLVAGT